MALSSRSSGSPVNAASISGRACAAKSGENSQAGTGAEQHISCGGEFRERRIQRLHPLRTEPQDQRHMRLSRIDLFGRAPCVRQVGADQHEVAIVVSPDMIADEALTTRIERQGQFQFGMVVPLKRDAVVQPPVKHRPGRIRGRTQTFEMWLHSCTRSNNNARIVSDFASLVQHGCPPGAIFCASHGSPAEEASMQTAPKKDSHPTSSAVETQLKDIQKTLPLRVLSEGRLAALDHRRLCHRPAGRADGQCRAAGQPALAIRRKEPGRSVNLVRAAAARTQDEGTQQHRHAGDLQSPVFMG